MNESLDFRPQFRSGTLGAAGYKKLATISNAYRSGRARRHRGRRRLGPEFGPRARSRPGGRCHWEKRFECLGGFGRSRWHASSGLEQESRFVPDRSRVRLARPSSTCGTNSLPGSWLGWRVMSRISLVGREPALGLITHLEGNLRPVANWPRAPASAGFRSCLSLHQSRFGPAAALPRAARAVRG